MSARGKGGLKKTTLAQAIYEADKHQTAAGRALKATITLNLGLSFYTSPTAVSTVMQGDSRDTDESSWRQRQQQQQQHGQKHTQSLSSDSPEQQLGVPPMHSWQQQHSMQPATQVPILQQQQYSQRPSYDYAPVLPQPMQPYPSASSYPSLPLQYPSQHTPPYYTQQHTTTAAGPPAQQPYDVAYASYPSPQPRHIPVAGGLPSWYSPTDTFYSEQVISPHESSRRHGPLEKQASPARSISTGSYTLPVPSPVDEGYRWSSYPGGHRTPSAYPSGLVIPHRGSYSTMSSSGSSSRSPSQPIAPPHHYHHPYPSSSSSASVLTPSSYHHDLSATSMIMPPPNPPPEVRMPVEQEMQRRASTACNFCRARKLRCDGSAPCRQCARRDLECVFSQSNLTKRRKKERDDEGDGDESARGKRVDMTQRQASGSSQSGSGGIGSRRGSTYYTTSTTIKRRSDRHDETELGRKQARSAASGVGAGVDSLAGAMFLKSMSSSPSMLQLPGDGATWPGETSWCRPPPLPSYTAVPWQHSGEVV